MKDREDNAPTEALRLAELGLLTAGLLHELRQPVFALKALAQLGDLHPERRAEYFEAAQAQVRTLEGLIEAYADFSRRPATHEIFELGAPVRSAMTVLEHRAVVARVAVDVAMGEALAVAGSRLAVQQAVVNLGQNALDAVRGAEGAWVRIAARVEGPHAVLTVHDNGPGLPSQIRDHLFEPFHTTKSHGTGLGLVLTRDGLLASGATLSLRDEGPGTCWEIRLPRVGGPG